MALQKRFNVFTAMMLRAAALRLLAPLLLLLQLRAAAATEPSFQPTAELPQLFDANSVHTPAQWETRRTELKQLLQEHILGTLPPPSDTPKLLSASTINSTTAGTISSAYVRREFAANVSRVAFEIELAWPTARPAGHPLPLFLTQWNHRAWGILGVQRGYMMALYPGSDVRDASGDFRAAYPAASFRKILARAFVASRVLDFLLADTPLPLDAGFSRCDTETILGRLGHDRAVEARGRGGCQCP